MSEIVAIIGASGSGKSTAIESLNPKETMVISVLGKPLPFLGWKKKYSGVKKNYMVTAKAHEILKTLKYVNNSQPDIKTVVLDDFQYIMATELMKRAGEKGYDKFTDVGTQIWNIIRRAQTLRDDLTVFFLAHEEDAQGGKRKMKTIGKMLDSWVTLEGMFTTVLFATTSGEDGVEYQFQTQTDGYTTAKSPRGMFEEVLIPNELQYVREKMDEYNN